MIFFDYFVRSISKKSLWAKRVAQANKEEDISTVSDEAFALLAYENNIERWTDIYSKDPNALLPRLGSGKKKQYTESLVPTKYTRGGIQYGSQQMDIGGRFDGKGWSNEGIMRYNELYDQVMQDRKQHPKFFESYADYYKTKYNKSKPNKRRKIAPTVVQAKHNLFGNLDNDDDDKGNIGNGEGINGIAGNQGIDDIPNDSLVDNNPSSDEEEGGEEE